MGRIARIFRAWNRRCTSGMAAVEFAMIAPVFFLLLMAIVETGMVYFAETTLENGVETAGRMIRTGQVQAGNMTQTAFRQAICDNIDSFMSCDSSKLSIDIRAFSNFGTASYPPAFDADGKVNPALNAYQPGTSCQVVLVRAFYAWDLFTPLFSNYFANLGHSRRLLTASIAFRNEPYGITPC